MRRHRPILIFCALFAVGCATEKLPETRNHAPIANGGADREAIVGELVSLDASLSTDADEDPLTFRWELKAPSGSAAVLDTTNATQTAFTPDLVGMYEIRLVATDGVDDSPPDTIRVEARAASAANQAPRALVGSNVEVLVGTSVTLDGRDSSDPDNDPLFFEWSIQTRPTGSSAQLDQPSSPTPVVTPEVAGPYEISLVVSDGELSSPPEVVVVTAIEEQNRPPIADAGRDIAVATGSQAQLDGTNSADPEGAQLTYIWSLVSAPTGSTASLSAADVARPLLQTDVDGVYVAQLVVDDGELQSGPDTVEITAASGNVPPSANAGPDQTVDVGSLVVLDGTDSSDPENTTLTYAWAFMTRPTGSAAALSDKNEAQPSFTPDRAGTYVVDLEVFDGEHQSAPDSVTITAIDPNDAPVADAGTSRSGRAGENIMLDAGGSSDPDGDPLGYLWTVTFQPPGSSVTLSDETTARPTFVGDTAGTYTISLVVSDGELESAPDQVTVTLTYATPGAESDVVITEFMADPNTLSDTAGEWFELYNPTSTTWDLEGCVLEDLGIDAHTINAPVVIGPMAHATLARSASPGFGPDYVYGGTFPLANGGDEIIVTCGGIEIAQIVYSSTTPGVSKSLLRSKMDEVANDDDASWCSSQASYNGDTGTPGAPNEFDLSCP